jgi:rare lipoprotein A
VRRLHPHASRRARPLLAIALASCALAAGTAQAADGGEGVGSEPLTSLGAVETTDGSSDSDGAPTAGGSIVPEGSVAPTDPAAPVDPAVATDAIGAPAEPQLDTDATDAELTKERDRLVAERNALQEALLRHEANRQEAERRVDAALDAIAQRLVDLFDQRQDARLQALMGVRDEADAAVREQLVAALDPAERTLVAEHDAATAAAAVVGERADEVRRDVLALGTRVAAIEALLEDRAGPTAAELARERGDRYSFDADYVFATGPIPGIGYWGAMSGGGALSGWMGYAGAAVGGIGCDPTDATMKPTGTVESGEASWYGPGFDGDPTANGEVFDTTQLTAAHRTLPFGTIVRVYSSATARCVFVRINDRGPFVDGRVIDLSRAAADAIGMESVAPVQLEVYASS